MIQEFYQTRRTIRRRVKSVDFCLMISVEWTQISWYILRDLFRVANTHCIWSQKIELCQVIVVDWHACAFQFRERWRQGLQVSRSKTRPGSHRMSLSLSVSSFVLIIPLSSRHSSFTVHLLFDLCTSFLSLLVLPIVFESASHGNGRRRL